jgi:protein-disulfide isomerase
MDDFVRLVSPVSRRDHAAGPPDAPLTLVEYGDYECTFCAPAADAVRRLRKTLGGRLRFVFRNFPLTGIHMNAFIAAQAAEAAALQGKFWEMHDELFARQRDLEPGLILAWARSAGVDPVRLGHDIAKGAGDARIKEDVVSGAENGINVTPCFFIGGSRYDGAADYASLLEAAESVLEPRLA